MTPRHTPEVLIAGGGIGGLCLAHGLRNAGIPVRVLERTRSRTDWVQGYRIHIDPHGSEALHHCLGPTAWKVFLDSVSDGAAGFAFRTEQLRTLLEVTDARASDPTRSHHGISRIALREALLTDLEDVVEFGRAVDRYTVEHIGTDDPGATRVTAHLADGTTATADLLVGADGANSRIRSQLLPHARRVDTGVVAIAGQYRLDRDDRPPLPATLASGAVNVLPADRGFLFTAVWHADPAHTSVTPDDAPTGFLFDTRSDYVFWAYADAATAFPPHDHLAALPGAQLRDLVAAKLTHWSPDLRRLIADCEPDTVNALRVRSAEPVRPWTTGPVTLLGDAIHNMTPMAGIGANTALRDADLLRTTLITVTNGERGLVPALADYERQMLGYGFAAVAQSLRNARTAGSANRPLRAVMRTGFRLLNHIPAAKARMLA